VFIVKVPRSFDGAFPSKCCYSKLMFLITVPFTSSDCHCRISQIFISRHHSTTTWTWLRTDEGLYVARGGDGVRTDHVGGGGRRRRRGARLCTRGNGAWTRSEGIFRRRRLQHNGSCRSRYSRCDLDIVEVIVAKVGAHDGLLPSLLATHRLSQRAELRLFVQACEVLALGFVIAVVL